MVTTEQEVLDTIEGYVRARGIAETTFGRLAVNDGKLVGRLRRGEGITLATVRRIQQYIEDNPAAMQAAE